MERVKEKPIHVKPNLYTYFMEEMKIVAKNHGYNLLVHGSMNRDLDLIAVPWVNDPKPEIDLVVALHECLSGTSYANPKDQLPWYYDFTVLPGGRHSYVINMARHGEWNNFQEDKQYYLDISFTPLKIEDE